MGAIQQKFNESTKRALAQYKKIEAGLKRCEEQEAKLADARDKMADIIGGKIDGDDMTPEQANAAKEKYQAILLDLGRVREARASFETARDHVVICLGHDPKVINSPEWRNRGRGTEEAVSGSR